MGIPKSDLPKIKLPKIKFQKSTKTKENETLDVLKIEALSWKEQGNSLYKKGNYEGALSCYNKALENDRYNPDILHNKNMVLSRLGRVK